MRAGIRGLIITAAFIGPGTITTATIVGAETAYSLIWLLVFAVLATYILQEMASRVGTVSGLGLSEAIMSCLPNKALKIVIGALVVVAIGVGNAAYEGGNITGAALGLSASFGGDIKYWALGLGTTALLLILSGHYSLVEKCLIALVVVMSLVFFSIVLLVGIDFSLLRDGLLLESSLFTNTTLALAIIGTTIVPYNLFLHAGLSASDKNSARDHNSDIEDQQSKTPSIKHQNKQLLASIGIGGLVTFAVLSSSVSAYFVTQTVVDKSNIASQLAPLLGDYASLFFGVGLFAAGLTSAITAPLAAAYAISGLFKWKPSLDNWQFKLTAATIILIGTVVASIGLKPIALILVAQTSNALLLPISAALLVWVCNNHALLGKHKNSAYNNIAAGSVLLLVLCLAAYKLLS
jgi:NRAMP (natural resistance-associated macrophage protein)-like metal ion transporter